MSKAAAESIALTGRSIVAGDVAGDGGQQFTGYHPGDGRVLESAYFSASVGDVERAVSAAVAAAPIYANTSGTERGRFLRTIADGLDAAAEQLIERAQLETALPIPRLKGEVGRTSGQLRLFATVVEEGSWVNARIDAADPGRTPPQPDIRSMLRPLGPVVVFGASNFPLAFSTAGGDTASALAAGNPIIFKAHPAHPGTGELAGRIIADAVRSSGLPAGIFSLLFDAGHQVGSALVKHPAIQAVAFTGSFRGGRALMDLAAQRHQPIPVYAEMGSTNPVFVLPGALAARSEELAKGLHGSFTLGGGQFCTKPGMVFVEQTLAGSFVETLRSATAAGPAFSLLTAGIASAYSDAHGKRNALLTAKGATGEAGFAAQPILVETTGEQFLQDPSLSEEIFGPTTLLVHVSGKEQILQAANGLEGHLTATILGTEDDLKEYGELLQTLEAKVGRVIFNAFPTGVEVCHSMVHGGPYPSTSDGRSTSVGSQAIFRFVRPVAYQGLPQWALLPALQDDNPLGILRLYNGAWTGKSTE
jgi:alpha-ketoglutaric semialdehyde dehydrogenase